MENESGAVDPINRIWDFFTSVKLTVGLLLSLAATSIIGTLIPQNENSAVYLRAYGDFFYRFFDVLGLFDMYHSWWFQLLLLMLLLNVVVCSVDRFPGIWKIVRGGKNTFNKDRFRSLNNRQEFTVSVPIDELKASCIASASRFFRNHSVEKTKNGFVFFGEKGRWTRLGVFTVHTSVVFLLIGGLIGSFFGFQGFVTIPEGGVVDSVYIQKSNRMHQLDFQIQCDGFYVSYYDTHARMPKEYRSTLTIVENGMSVLTRDILVNHPLRYKGLSIFQSSFGKLPPKEPPSIPLSEEDIRLNIVSSTTGRVYQNTTAVGRELDLPEQMGKLIVKEYMAEATFGGQKIGEALRVILAPNNSPPTEILLPVRFPNFDRMRRGDQVISVVLPKGMDHDARLEHKEQYYTGLQVTRDPGVGVVYTGFILMIIGCFVTFFMSHQRLYIEGMQSGKTTRVIVSGTANKNKLGIQKRVEKIAQHMKKTT